MPIACFGGATEPSRSMMQPKHRKNRPHHSESVAIRCLPEIAMARKQYTDANRHFEKAAALQPECSIRTHCQARLARRPARTGRLARSQRMDAGWQGADSTLILDRFAIVNSTQLCKASPHWKKAPNTLALEFPGLVYLSQQDYRGRAKISKRQSAQSAYLQYGQPGRTGPLRLTNPRPLKPASKPSQADKSNLEPCSAGGPRQSRRQFHGAARVARTAHKSAPQAPQPLVLLSIFYLNQGNSARRGLCAPGE